MNWDPFWKTLEILLRFVIDIALGLIGFVLVGLAALGIGSFVGWLEVNGVSPTIIDIMHYLEYFLFGIDVLGFAFLVLMSFTKLVREIWRSEK